MHDTASGAYQVYDGLVGLTSDDKPIFSTALRPVSGGSVPAILFDRACQVKVCVCMPPSEYVPIILLVSSCMHGDVDVSYSKRSREDH